MINRHPDTEPRPRSPRFPFISVAEALKRAADLFVRIRSHSVSLEETLSVWGFSSKSSGGLQMFAALKMYGLLEELGRGGDKRVRLTREAQDYLGEPTADKVRWHRYFASHPAILKLLEERWGSHPPDTALGHLEGDYRFTAKAAVELLRIYRENIAFSPLNDADEPSFAREEGGWNQGGQTMIEDKKIKDNDVAEVLRFLVAPGKTVHLLAVGGLSAKDISACIRMLEVQRDVLLEVEIK